MTDRKHDALKSLYGKGHVDATRTRECVAMPGRREQTILTPQCIVDGLKAFWPHGIEMDPCSAPGQLFTARQNPKDGLAVDWPKRTFCNPPYAVLQKWMQHGQEYDEVIWLVPARTHRKWFRIWAGQMDVLLWLDPLKFVGFKQAFPAPLVLGYAGAERSRFLEPFGHLGGQI